MIQDGYSKGKKNSQSSLTRTAQLQGYPRRPSHFAHKFTRLMVKCCLCQELGTGAFALLTTIAHTEDAAHYRRPVTWYNGQLMAVLGMSKDQLVRVRKKCVDDGWLHYEPGTKSRAGKYWVCTPEYAEGLDDLPTDEGSDDIPSGIQTANPPDARRQTLPIADGKPSPFNPNPNPDPNPSSSPRIFSDEDMETAKWMFSLIHKLNPDMKKPKLESWADIIRLMRESDNRTDHKIRELFTWVNNDDFNRRVVLSPEKLRKRFDELETQRRNPRTGNRRNDSAISGAKYVEGEERKGFKR